MKGSPFIYRFLYAGFTLFGIYKLITGNHGDAAIHLGIALAFDPFDQSVTWKDRPNWQQTWRIIHLVLCASAFGFEVGTNDNIK